MGAAFCDLSFGCSFVPLAESINVVLMHPHIHATHNDGSRSLSNFIGSEEEQTCYTDQPGR